MGEHEFCRAILTEASQQAKWDLGMKIPEMHVDKSDLAGGKRYFWVVNDETREVIWEGAECCAWSARFNAIEKLVQKFKQEGRDEESV